MTKNNKTTQYFVEIIPTGYYFFGNERTFMTTVQDKYSETITNYFAESNILPQQTAVLGMLRYTLLALYDKLNATQAEKALLIGKEGFSENKDHAFGLIEAISPIFIFEQVSKMLLMPIGFDHQKYEKVDTHFVYNHAENVPTYLYGNAENVPDLEKYNYKEELNLLWKDTSNKVYTEEELFKSITKVGVNKVKTDEAFYKQTFKGLKEKGYAFGVWVDFDESIDETKLKEILVPFGADQGLFKLRFRTDIPYMLDEQRAASPTQILLLSDAWIAEKTFEDIDFGITQYTDFRFIEEKTRDYYNLQSAGKSTKFVLLKRGSVLYPKPDFNIKDLQHDAFCRIGYNYFQHAHSRR